MTPYLLTDLSPSKEKAASPSNRQQVAQEPPPALQLCSFEPAKTEASYLASHSALTMIDSRPLS